MDRLIACLLITMSLSPAMAAEPQADAEPTWLDDSLPPTRTFVMPWTDGNGVSRVDQLTIDEFMAMIDQTSQDRDKVASIFEMKERLLEVRSTKFELLKHINDPDFDAVYWQRLCREHRRLVKALAPYNTRVNEHLQRRIDGQPSGYKRPALYRVTGNPDRDREYVLGPAAYRQPAGE